MQGVWALIYTIQTKKMKNWERQLYHSYIIGKWQILFHNIN